MLGLGLGLGSGLELGLGSGLELGLGFRVRLGRRSHSKCVQILGEI